MGRYPPYRCKESKGLEADERHSIPALLDCVSFNGPFRFMLDPTARDVNSEWLFDVGAPLAPPPGVKKFIQAYCYDVIAPLEIEQDPPSYYRKKLCATLSDEIFFSLRLSDDWYEEVVKVLPLVGPHVQMCIWKSWTGAWTTSHRMHEAERLDCLFGCRSCTDTFTHYLFCPVLWHTVGEALQMVLPYDIAERLCVRAPSVSSLRGLALAFQGYHYIKSLRLYESDRERGNFCATETAMVQALRAYKVRF